MKNWIAFCIFFLSVSICISQADIPDSFALETPEDYDELEDLVEESLKWLLDTPMNAKLNTRNEQNAFVMLWLTGSPKIIMEVHTKAMPFLEHNEELMYVFFHGMAYYKMNHLKNSDIVLLHAHGLNAVAKQVLLTENYVEKDKFIRKLMKAHRKNKMKEYAAELLNEEG